MGRTGVDQGDVGTANAFSAGDFAGRGGDDCGG